MRERAEGCAGSGRIEPASNSLGASGEALPLVKERIEERQEIKSHSQEENKR